MKTKFTIVALLLTVACLQVFAQPPLVYTVENTGAGCAAPPLPFLSQLPIIDPLTDPFMKSDNSGRSLNFSDWQCRRNEIKREIENYEIGIKPPKPDSLTASFSGTTLTVVVTRNGKTLTITSAIALPSGTGPFPAVIGMNSPSGGIPTTVFSGRNIARITFSHNNVTTYGSPSLANPFYQLYPEFSLSNSGQYSAWAWGVSRIIDGLELVQATLPIDLKRIAVTGCSYAGKMALFSGALDERIALTIAQESGGGGAPSWRVSETLGNVEKLGSTDYTWFRDSMVQFSGANVSKLPHDHHELMAMIAPRALLVTGNTDFEWLANPSTYVSARAAHEVWKNFGVADRFGFYIDGGHAHCAVPATQVPAIQAFVDKFLVGDVTVNTDTITIHPYGDLNYNRWYQWWGSGNPVFPDEASSVKLWLEAECGSVGTDWNVLSDTAASKGIYVQIKNGLNSTGAAPTGPNSTIVLPFSIDSAGNYNFIARVNCPSVDDDSYWVKIDNGAFITANGLTSVGWQWARLISNVALTAGPHTFTITYREDGAKLDKVLVTTSNSTILGKGFDAANCSALPVNLVSYQATLKPNGEVLLSWSTASELNNKQYRLERSTDGINFAPLASVDGKGTFNGKSDYSYIDVRPVKGLNYYRLIQVNMDGRELSLGIKTIKINSGKTLISIYPNPAKSRLNIDLGTNETTQKQVSIYNTSGKMIFSKLINVANGVAKVNLDVHTAPGIYLVKIGDERVNVVLE